MSLPIAHLLPACLRGLAAAAGPAPAHPTLDHLRADLSHEMAAKHARLAGLLREWRAGRFRDDDAEDAAMLCRDIERLYRRNARVAAAGLRSFGGLVRVLAVLRALRSAAVQSARAQRSDSPALATAERRLPELTAASRRLVEALSARHGARFGELVTAAAEGIRREAAAAGQRGVPVVLESADGGAAVWVPRTEAARWSDLLRNLIRNAVQAVEESPRAAANSVPPAVVVRLQPLPSGGTAVTISDLGLGMDAAQVAAMWHDGRSRHGAGHGQGLTEAKRAFVEQRAVLRVDTEAGAGTRVALELPARDIAFRVPWRLASPPLALPTILVLALLALVTAQLRHGEMVTVRVTNEHLATALDRRGRTLWQRQFPERIRANWRSLVQTDRAYTSVEVPLLLVTDSRGRRLVILVTAPDQGPGRVLALDRDGRERWSRTLRWTPPRVAHAGNLIAAFQAATVWNDGGREAIALNVRDGNWSSTSIQFLSADGDSLGAYLHPGHLEFLGSGDIDGDGRVELLLNGKNNDAAHDPAFWPAGDAPDDAYSECLILLETPMVGGQAFPARRWDSQPRAREDAYLLVPPLTAADFADPRATAVTRLVLGRPRADGSTHHEIYLRDGRIYELDRQLRPLSCSAGDHTPASGRIGARPAAPLLLFHAGRVETFDLPVAKGR